MAKDILDALLDSSPEEETEETNPSQEGEDTTEEVEETDEQSEEETTDAEEDNTPDEPRVPYERFDKVNQERKEFKEKLEAMERKLNEFSQKTSDQSDNSIPEELKGLIGDDEHAQKFVHYLSTLKQSAAKEAIETMRKEQQELKQREEAEMQRAQEQLQEELESIEYKKNIKFTGKTKEATRNRNELLKIVEEYSYGDDVIPIEKAYDIFELKKAQKANANKAVAKKVNNSNVASDSSISENLSWDDL